MTERERLEALIERLGMSGSEFSRAIGISSGTLSNILNGRNRPSFDVMQSVLRRFPQVSTSWLVLGEGGMLRDGAGMETAARAGDASVRTLAAGQESVAREVTPPRRTETAGRRVVKVMVFYDDGTYDELKVEG